MTEILDDGPKSSKRRLILAHGAGAAMDTPFMNAIADGLAAEGVRVMRFEFGYMAARRTSDKRPGPGRAEKLVGEWTTVLDKLGGGAKNAVGGKSMGGRVASLLADDAKVRGLVCLGYPFHPPGKPDNLRTAHLEGLKTPALIVQGTRDPMGNRDEVAGYALSKRIKLCWLEDGDHSLKPRKSSGFSADDHLASAVRAIDAFLHKL